MERKEYTKEELVNVLRTLTLRVEEAESATGHYLSAKCNMEMDFEETARSKTKSFKPGEISVTLMFSFEDKHK